MLSNIKVKALKIYYTLGKTAMLLDVNRCNYNSSMYNSFVGK